jgi:hypothetical protein
MRVERVLWTGAVVCAVLLLFAPFTPRTTWTQGSGAAVRHSAGWDWVAALLAIMAIVGLSVGMRSRPRVLMAVSGAAIAAAFAGSAAASIGHWVSLTMGALDRAGWSLQPAPYVGLFAVIAGIGAICSLIRLRTWLRPGEPPA